MAENEFHLGPAEIAEDMMVERMAARRSARFRVFLRGALAVFVSGMALWFVEANWLDIGYYFRGGAPVIDLGDVRNKGFDPAALGALETNDRVRFRNDVIMFDGYIVVPAESWRGEQQGAGYSFYYSPVTHFVVRTQQALPDKTSFQERDSLITLDAWGVDMVSRKLVFPWDLMVSIDCEGRFIRYEDVPTETMPALSFMSNSSRYPAESMYLFLDGEKPENKAGSLYLFIGALIIMAASLAFFVDSLVRYSRCK